jgi:hypothetical protein
VNHELRQVVMPSVDGMLVANPELATIAQDDCLQGMKQRWVRDCLGRALLVCYWYAAKVDCAGDPNEAVARRFAQELKRT